MQTRQSRVSVLVRFLIVALLLVCAASAGFASEPLALEPVRLRLVLVDLSGMAPNLRQGVLEELRTLLEPIGVRATTRVVPAGQQLPSGGVFVVLLPFDPSRGRAEPTGGVSMVGSTGQATVWGFPPKVADALGLDLDRFDRWTNQDRQDFHRALAVVVLHELAHVLAGAGHRLTGLMSPQLRRQALLDPHLALDAELHEAFRAGIARANWIQGREAPPAVAASRP